MASNTRPSLVVSCEHGGNRIPQRYAPLFADEEALLRSHRGWDPGALFLARSIAATFHAPLFFSTTSRLLVDLNRSSGHPRVFSAITRSLSARDRSAILARWYRPYRERVERALLQEVGKGGEVVHLSVHSFTPVLDGKVRRVEIGLLYDPSRPLEREFCRRMGRALMESKQGPAGHLRIRFNQPYLGRSDGFTTYLRGRFPAAGYAGIELEVNQRLISGARVRQALISGLIREALRSAISSPLCQERERAERIREKAAIGPPATRPGFSQRDS